MQTHWLAILAALLGANLLQVIASLEVKATLMRPVLLVTTRCLAALSRRVDLLVLGANELCDGCEDTQSCPWWKIEKRQVRKFASDRDRSNAALGSTVASGARCRREGI